MPKSNLKGGKIYLDYASSALSTSANPGAIHALGVKEKNKLEESRATIAKILNAQRGEIVFTSGATESNNLAILGSVYAAQAKNSSIVPHVLTTNIEHASVLEVCKHLEKTRQAEVTFVPVEENGIVAVKKIKEALRPNTILVSVMYANNEIGTIQPIREIAKEIRHHNKMNLKKASLNDPSVGRAFFHIDATQAVNYLSINVAELGVDMLSMNGAKIYGPKGIGALYVKKGTPISKIMFGGDQEFGLRPGTENAAGVEALAEALKVVEKIKAKEVKRLTKLQAYFLSQLIKKNNFVINGDLKNRLPNNINITIPNIPSDLLVIELSERGIMVAGKSACKAGDGKASHVIESINKNIKDTDGSLRLTLGRETKKKDIDRTVQALSQILTKLKTWYN